MPHFAKPRAPIPAVERPAPSAAAERALEGALLGCVLITLLTTLGILVVLGRGAVSAASDAGVLLGSEAWPGLAPLLVGTLLTSAIAIVVAVPLGLLAAIFLAEFATPRLRAMLEPILELLAGLPTVVWGYVALVVVTPTLQRVVPGLAGLNALSPGIVIGVMIVPMIASLSESAISAVPRSLREAAWALGADPVETITRVVLPAAAPGIVAASVLAVSRALGETMIVTIAAGRQPSTSLDPRAPIETMTSYVVEVASGGAAVDSPAYHGLMLAGVGLFGLTLVTNAVGLRLARRSRRSP